MAMHSVLCVTGRKIFSAWRELDDGGGGEETDSIIRWPQGPGWNMKKKIIFDHSDALGERASQSFDYSNITSSKLLLVQEVSTRKE
jgi:hypothetical protein